MSGSLFSDVKICDTPACLNLRRNAAVRKQCSQYRNSTSTDNLHPQASANYYHLIADDKHRVIYCYVPKTACTALKYLQANNTSEIPVKMNMNIHAPSALRKAGLKFMSDIKNETERHYKLEHYKTILVVRNPFERLYSGYIDKFINTYKQYGTNNAYRGITMQLFPKTKARNGNLFITFEQFLQMVILAKRTMLPSLARPRGDEHWSTIGELCYPCDVRYDFILKLHMLDRDKELILPLFNATYLPHMNIATIHKENIFNVTIPDIITAYHQLTPHLIQDIRDIYKLDLELFGYGFDIHKGILNDLGI